MTEWWQQWGVAVFVVTVALGVYAYKRQQRLGVLRDIAAALRMEARTGFFADDAIVGDFDGMPVRVVYAARTEHKRHYPTVATVAGGVVTGLRIRRRGMLTGAGEPTGDPAFDGAFVVEGPADVVPALLDGETRRLLTDLFHLARGEVVRGELNVEVDDDGSHPRLVARLRATVALARALAHPGDALPQRLARVALHDVEPGCRLMALEALLRGGGPLAEETARAALTDDAAPVLALARGYLGGREAGGRRLEAGGQEP